MNNDIVNKVHIPDLDGFKKNKNNKIFKMIKLLETEYLNSQFLINLDKNPKHFIDEYQFIKYVSNYLNDFDPHYYQSNIISYKYYVAGYYNKHGYLCLDYGKINIDLLDGLINNNVKNLKVVIDLRGANKYRIGIKTFIGFLSKFSIIKNRFVENKKIYEFLDKNGITDEYMIYSRNMLKVFDSQNKLIDKFEFSKAKVYDCDEIVCITNYDNLSSLVINALGVPVYVNAHKVMVPELYNREKIGSGYIYVPAVTVNMFSEYSSTLGIPEKYYAGI